MTPDRNTLLKLIKEYGDSLLRIESEKDLQKAIAEQAEVECQVKPAQFKKAAMAYFKDKVKALRDELGEQMDLLDVIRGDAPKTAVESILGVFTTDPYKGHSLNFLIGKFEVATITGEAAILAGGLVKVLRQPENNLRAMHFPASQPASPPPLTTPVSPLPDGKGIPSLPPDPHVLT